VIPMAMPRRTPGPLLPGQPRPRIARDDTAPAPGRPTVDRARIAQRALELLREPLARRDLRAQLQCGWSDKQVLQLLSDLRDAGQVKRIGKREQSLWVCAAWKPSKATAAARTFNGDRFTPKSERTYTQVPPAPDKPTSWWATESCQTSRDAFAQRRQVEQPRMERGEFGKRAPREPSNG